MSNFIDSKVLENLIIDGEKLNIANEGFFDKLKQAAKGTNLPEGMSEVAALHKYLDDKKYYNKTEEQTTDNAYGAQIYNNISEKNKQDPGAAMVGMEVFVHTYNSPNSKYPMWVAITYFNKKPDSFIIPYIKRNNIEFKWKDVVRHANQK